MKKTWIIVFKTIFPLLLISFFIDSSDVKNIILIILFKFPLYFFSELTILVLHHRVTNAQPMMSSDKKPSPGSNEDETQQNILSNMYDPEAATVGTQINSDQAELTTNTAIGFIAGGIGICNVNPPATPQKFFFGGVSIGSEAYLQTSIAQKSRPSKKENEEEKKNEEDE